MIEWTEGDDLAAEEEGWGLMYSLADSGLKVQLESLDDDLLDHVLWEQVVDKSITGSVLHRKALDFIKANNRMEHEAIMSWCEKHYQ